MAVGTLTTEQQKKNQPLGTQYDGLKGIQENTGVNMLKYQRGYQPTDRVLNAQTQLQQVQSQKPQGYNSKHADALDGILAQIQNPQEFKFSFNGDALWNNYKDMYTQLGRQASMDAIGQASALTGGYGNSYAQQAGQQGYQQYLLGLGDKAMDVYDRAYTRHRDAMGDLKDRYSIISDAEQQDYARYNDDYQKWLTERDFAAQQAQNADEQEYNRFADERAYWQNLAESENKDYWTETNYNEDVRRNNRDYDEDVRRNNRDYDEGVRQFNETLAEQVREFDADLAERVAQRQEEARQFDASLEWEKMSSDQKYAAGFVETMIANGQIPTVEQLMGVGMSEGDATNWVNQLVAAQQPVATGGGGGYYGPGPGNNTGGDNNGTGNDTLKSKNLVAQQNGVAAALMNNPQPLTATTPAGPVNTSVVVPNATTKGTTQSVEDILKNGIQSNRKVINGR